MDGDIPTKSELKEDSSLIIQPMTKMVGRFLKHLPCDDLLIIQLKQLFMTLLRFELKQYLEVFQAQKNHFLL